ncbi:MAG TPA: cell division protein FtsQ/DivIB [Burkholderiales bacterium]|nr:cell division protein FtsQ/DivIB [Burkholderiales bacterium]
MSARLALLAGMLSGLLMLAACLGGLYWLLLPQRFPVTQVELKGELKNVTRAQIEAALPRAAGNFFAADLAEVRASVERLAWVRRVAVRRVWPGRLEVAVEEHVALARWGTGDEMSRLVNTFGETFSANTKQALPVFVAPGGTAAEVVRRYRRFNELVAPLGTSVERVVLTQRLAWQLRLGNGLHVMLGRDADLAEERLRRFVESYAVTVGKTKKRHEYVDLRYPNGFALRVPDGSG